LRGEVLLWPLGATPGVIGLTVGRFRLGFWSTRMHKEKYAQEVISSLPKPGGAGWQKVKGDSGVW